MITTSLVTQTLPLRADHFTINGWSIVAGQPTIKCHYHCSRFGDFTEVLTFPVPPEAVQTLASDAAGHGLIDLLAVAVGVSYYKAGAAHRLGLGAVSPSAGAMATALYQDGLAEFAVRSGLPVPLDVEVEGPVEDEVAQEPAKVQPGPALVAFGGGKDSYVAREIIGAAGDAATLCSVILSPQVGEVLQATAPAPLTLLHRRLDPALADATAQGFNGHVPITAINMLMMSVYAAMTGARQVVFANERSADEPTMWLKNGIVANHQYSKSSAFEAILHRTQMTVAPCTPLAYSLLRPYAELWIGRAFAQIDVAFSKFTSCNRNFRLAGDADKRWCGNCAKCAFTSLIVAPFIGPVDGMRMFGRTLLDAPALMRFFEELLGLSSHKPWDCVGTISECRAALFAISQQPHWRTTRVVETFMERVLSEETPQSLRRIWDAALTPASSILVPQRYLGAGQARFA